MAYYSPPGGFSPLNYSNQTKGLLNPSKKTGGF